MLTRLSSKQDLKLNILSIDPGTINLGLCFATLDLQLPSFTVNYASTIDIYSIIHKSNMDYTDTYTRNISMIKSVYDIIFDLMNQFHPDWVICESPYMNSKFPLPYVLLTLCTQSINKAVLDYSNSVRFDFIDPASVKKSVGVKGNSGDKNLMMSAIVNLNDLSSLINLTRLDEHAIDSIAIGYSAYKQLKEL